MEEVKAMHYVCVENNRVTGVLSYEPNVPETITVVTITQQQRDNIESGTHYFDVESLSVKPHQAQVLEQKALQEASREHEKYLRSTDWQVLRHIRQKALGIPTSLSEAEYLELEAARQRAADAITH